MAKKTNVVKKPSTATTVESKNAKNARKSAAAKVNLAPKCHDQHMTLAKIMTPTGRTAGIKWYCQICQSTKEQVKFDRV